MRYIAFLRGINVGGNNIIRMAELKEVLEKDGFKQVKTYIQSGNVIFETEEKESEKIAEKIETLLSKNFHYEASLVLLTYEQFKKIIDEVPSSWKKPHDLRCYLAFIKAPTTADQVLKEIKLKEGVDFVAAGKGVIYMTTKLSGITQSGFTKLIGTKVYKELTMRNYNTVQKILSLMD